MTGTLAARSYGHRNNSSCGGHRRKAEAFTERVALGDNANAAGEKADGGPSLGCGLGDIQARRKPAKGILFSIVRPFNSHGGFAIWSRQVCCKAYRAAANTADN